MTDETLARRSACDLARLMRAGEASPLEILDAHLAVIERVNPAHNAIVTLVADDAKDAARDATDALIGERADLPALHGLPIVIKDIVDTAGIRTTYASPRFADHVPEQDAEVVTRLRKAGAIILGKTNTPEFAAGANTDNDVFGPTRNPWNREMSPSGSSGGSAVAVATGMVPLAQGTDYGCSLRMPAAFCGIVGLRPTPGLVPNDPLPMPWDFGQVHGPMARSAEDAAFMLDAMTGLSPLTPISVAPPWSSARERVAQTENGRGLRLAYVSDIAGIGIDPELERLCRAAAEGLADSGAVVEEISFDLSEARDAYLTLRAEWMVEQQYRHLDILGDFGPNLAGNVRAGLDLAVRDTAAARVVQEGAWHRYRVLFETYDALMTPMSPVPPFPVKQNYPDEIAGKKLTNYVDWIAPAFLVTLVSIPAGSAPVGLTERGLPVGLQIVAPRFGEPLILSLTKLIQQANPIGWPPGAGQ